MNYKKFRFIVSFLIGIVFTTPLFAVENIAQSGTAPASSQRTDVAGQEANKVNDGICKSDTSNRWYSNLSSTLPQWWKVTWPEPKNVQ